VQRQACARLAAAAPAASRELRPSEVAAWQAPGVQRPARSCTAHTQLRARPRRYQAVNAGLQLLANRAGDFVPLAAGEPAAVVRPLFALRVDNSNKAVRDNADVALAAFYSAVGAAEWQQRRWRWRWRWWWQQWRWRWRWRWWWRWRWRILGGTRPATTTMLLSCLPRHPAAGCRDAGGAGRRGRGAAAAAAP
jgi:hypothetical protein